MPQPITWRTVETDNRFRDASRILDSVGDRGDRVLGIAGQLLGQRQQLDAANANQGQENLKQSFLDSLQSARTPEQLAAMESQLPGMMEGMNAATKAAVRNAPDSRLTGLRQQLTTEQAFNNGQADQAEKPVLDGIGQLIANGSFGEARDAIANSSLRNKSTYLNNVNLAERSKQMQGREDQKYTQGQQLTGMEIQLKSEQFKQTQQANAEAAQGRELLAGAATAAQGRLKTPDLKAAIAESLRTGRPVPDLGPGSDTDAADTYYQGLRDSGKYSPQVLDTFRSKIRESFASNGMSPLIGREAAARDTAAAANAVAFEESNKSNWYAPGSPDARKNYEELAKDLPSLIDKTTGWDADEDIGELQKKLGDLAVNGIEVDGQRISPSTNDVRWALRTAKGGWLVDSTRSDSFMELLKERSKTSAFKQSIKDGEVSNQYRRQQAIKEKLNAK